MGGAAGCSRCCCEPFCLRRCLGAGRRPAPSSHNSLGQVAVTQSAQNTGEGLACAQRPSAFCRLSLPSPLLLPAATAERTGNAGESAGRCRCSPSRRRRCSVAAVRRPPAFDAFSLACPRVVRCCSAHLAHHTAIFCRCPYGRIGEGCEIDFLAPCRQAPDATGGRTSMRMFLFVVESVHPGLPRCARCCTLQHDALHWRMSARVAWNRLRSPPPPPHVPPSAPQLTAAPSSPRAASAGAAATSTISTI